MTLIDERSDRSQRRIVLDHLRFERVAVPESEEEVAEALGAALADKMAVIPVGGGTAIYEGNLPSAQRLLGLSSAGLNRNIDFSPADMVVTAGAGATLDSVQALLSQSNQFLPIDVPHPDHATLGGIVATNRSGLWRPAFGTVRDRLLGFRAVTADGSAIKGGGKVVKNVAGYDLCKLFASSRGTLGFLTEATFKTNPLPERRAHLAFSTSSPIGAIEAALEVHSAMLQPAYLVAVYPEQQLYVGLMGSSEAVEWQTREIECILVNRGLTPVEAAMDEDALRCRFTANDEVLAFRLTVRPSEVPSVVTALLKAGTDLLIRLMVAIPIGGIDAQIDVKEVDDSRLRAVIGRIASVRPPDGHLFWRSVPAAYRSEIPDVWTPRPGGFTLMKQLKSALDPQGLFSPGRFAGRL